MHNLVGKITNTLHRSLGILSVGILSATFAASAALAACRTAETEPNNSDTAANADVCAGTAISGSISNSADFVWYKLTVTAPGTI